MIQDLCSPSLPHSLACFHAHSLRTRRGGAFMSQSVQCTGIEHSFFMLSLLGPHAHMHAVIQARNLRHPPISTAPAQM